MKHLIPLSLLLMSSSAISAEGDFWANFHIGSTHSGDGYYDQRYDWKGKGELSNENAFHKYNEKNYGLGFVFEFEDFLDARAGMYSNSVNATSIYGGGSLHSSFTNPAAIGLMLGVVSGYDALTEMPVSLMVMPYLSFNTKYARAEITYLPGIGETDSIASLSLAFTF